jgi:ribosome-associated protein
MANAVENFELNGEEYIELKDLLKVTGLCESGGQAKAVISDGEVLVDGIVETRKACKIKAGQVVQYTNTTIHINAGG